MLNIAQISCPIFKWRNLSVALCWTVAVVSLSAVGFAGDKATQSSASIKRGDQLFHRMCVSCHNKQPGDASPFGPPNLYDVLGRREISSTLASDIIRRGRSQMPPFGARITDGQISDVIAYLQAH